MQVTLALKLQRTPFRIMKTSMTTHTMDVAVGANDADSVDEFGDEKDNGRGSKEEERCV